MIAFTPHGENVASHPDNNAKAITTPVRPTGMVTPSTRPPTTARILVSFRICRSQSHAVSWYDFDHPELPPNQPLDAVMPVASPAAKLGFELAPITRRTVCDAAQTRRSPIRMTSTRMTFIRMTFTRMSSAQSSESATRATASSTWSRRCNLTRLRVPARCPLTGPHLRSSSPSNNREKGTR